MNADSELFRDIVYVIGAPESAWGELFNQWRLARERGSRGLDFLFPPDLSHIHLNYGQGEGQVEIWGLEIGIYQRSSEQWTIVAHDFPLEKEFDQPDEIAERISAYWEKLVSTRFFICRESP